MLLIVSLGMLCLLPRGIDGQATAAFEFINYLKSESFSQVLETKEVSLVCGNHLLKWLTGMQKGEMWALQMMDSIQKIVDGIFMGRLHIPGHFDECVEATNEEFAGKHCMVPTTLNVFTDLTPKRWPSKDGIPVTYFYGLCVPATCSTNDLNVILNNASLLQTNLTDEDCSTDKLRPFRPEDWGAVALISFFFLLAVASTLYDLCQRFKFQNENPNRLLTSFSLYTNVTFLLRISNSASELKCLNGIRFLSIAWVVLGHSYMALALAAPVNFAQVPKFFLDKNLIVVNNAYLSVETFFFLSGLLVCLVFFRDISKKGSFDVPLAFIHRYVRVTPAFAAVMFLQATVISRMGNGPFWNSHMDNAESGCRRSWWSGILYIQNYLKPELLCLGQSWYLSTDMQMFWLSPFFLYPMLFWPAFAPVYLGLLVLASTLTNFTAAFVNEFEPNLSIAMAHNRINQFKYEYIRLHTRMTPWFIGLATGYLICGIKAKKIRLNLSRNWILLGWIIGLGLCCASLFSIARFLSYEYTPLESAFYLAFHRAGWSCGLAWIVIACISGYGGPINYFLSLDFFQPLAKLSYCTFLVHMTLQLCRLYSARLNQYIKNYDIIYNYVGDIVLANIFAVPVTLLFELPFSNIDRYLLQTTAIFPFPKRSQKISISQGGIKENSERDKSKDLEKGTVNVTFQKES